MYRVILTSFVILFSLFVGHAHAQRMSSKPRAHAAGDRAAASHRHQPSRRVATSNDRAKTSPTRRQVKSAPIESIPKRFGRPVEIPGSQEDGDVNVDRFIWQGRLRNSTIRMVDDSDVTFSLLNANLESDGSITATFWVRDAGVVHLRSRCVHGLCDISLNDTSVRVRVGEDGEAEFISVDPGGSGRETTLAATDVLSQLAEQFSRDVNRAMIDDLSIDHGCVPDNVADLMNQIIDDFMNFGRSGGRSGGSGGGSGRSRIPDDSHFRHDQNGPCGGCKMKVAGAALSCTSLGVAAAGTITGPLAWAAAALSAVECATNSQAAVECLTCEDKFIDELWFMYVTDLDDLMSTLLDGIDLSNIRHDLDGYISIDELDNTVDVTGLQVDAAHLSNLFQSIDMEAAASPEDVGR